LRDWLASADTTQLQEGVAQHTAYLTEMGASHDEVASVVAEHTPTGGGDTQIA
jgi:hypothetical protein